jgi:uncharacterized membrane-anchored protein YitT (DUF2179 family)
MNHLFSRLLVDIARKKITSNQTHKQKVTAEQLQLVVQNLKVDISYAIKDCLLITIGVFSAGFGLKGFLLPNHFIDGGATGISLLIQNITTFPLGLLLLFVNLPFVILATKTVGKKFALKSILAITLLAIVVHSIDYPIITEDKLLISIFGGFFLGLGIGMAMRGGSVIDGTEVLAIYLSRKLSLTIGDVLLLINIVIFSVGAYILSIEVALYAILTYLAAAKTVDYVVDGVEEYLGITIISKHHSLLQNMITNKLGRACTIYAGKGGYETFGESHNKEIIYTVVTRLELAKLYTEIDKIDKDAFTIVGIVKDLKGGMIKKKPLK